MDHVPAVRRFNRTVTRHIGALDGHFLGRDRSLGACRLLFEIGAGGAAIKDLRERLGLDSGYMSRLLRGLEREHLIKTGADPDDRRARFATLTAAGRKELNVLNQLSDKAAAGLLDRLPAKQRTALADAMTTVERLLRAGAVHLDLADPHSAVAQRCLTRYYEELAERFEKGFDLKRSPVTPDDMSPPKGLFVLATLDGDAVGCGGLRMIERYAEIKRMWVARDARGLGIGRRLLEYLEQLARKRRFRVLRLETNKSLTEAQALYRSAGFREIDPYGDEPYAHHFFEKALA